jgi:uncharacterized membrane protein
MNRKPAIIASGAIVIAMLIVSAWAWTQLAPGSKIPVHWGANGLPDRYADKIQALLQLPAVAIVLTMLFAALPKLAANRMHMAVGLLSEEALVTIWKGVWLACMLAVGGNHAATILPAAGAAPTTVVQIEIGLLFVIFGAYHLGTVSRTSLLGVRTPWNLSSELAWDRSQQLAGQIFVAMGLVLVALALLGNAMLVLGGFVSASGGCVIALMAYSYWLWKIDPQRPREAVR